MANFEDDESTHESHMNFERWWLLSYFYLEKIIKSCEYLITFSSVLEVLLSGPITLRNSCYTGVCFETHSMRCNVENIDFIMLVKVV